MLFVEKLIKSIVENKEMPKVQVEREISPILEIFIEDIMKEASKFKDNISDGNYKLIAPEFPLQSKKMEKDKKTNRSTNIDFLLLNENTNDLYFVELKTDSSSFKRDQFDIYDELISNKSITPPELYTFLDGLENEKYINLKKYLLEKMANSKDNDENPFEKINKIKLVYIAPKEMMKKPWKGKNESAISKLKEKHTVIYFSELKKIKVSKYDSEWDTIIKYIVSLDEN